MSLAELHAGCTLPPRHARRSASRAATRGTNSWLVPLVRAGSNISVGSHANRTGTMLALVCRLELKHASTAIAKCRKAGPSPSYTECHVSVMKAGQKSIDTKFRLGGLLYMVHIALRRSI